MKEYHFKATLEDAGGGGVFITFPYNVKKEFGKGRVPVQCTFDGEPYRGTLVKYGTPHHVLIVLKAIREKLGKKAGDSIHIWVKEDTQKRSVKIPDDFGTLLKKHNLEKSFGKLSFTHQKEHVVAITGAKRPETRLNRMMKAMDILKAKK